MTTVKATCLASAASLLLCGGAMAADLGVKKPSPVEYVKVCNTYGAGFFYIPGGNTCVKLGGRVRFQYGFSENRHAGYNAGSDLGFRSQGHIQFDARTATEYGTLRTFVRLLLNSRTGQQAGGSQQRIGGSTVPTGADFTGLAATNLDLLAFIQFAGFTAGRSGSFFDFYGGDYSWIGTTMAGHATTFGGGINLFAYTATFGQGFSATLSIEDPISARQFIATGRDGTVAAGNIASTGRAPFGVAATAANQSFYGGAQTPDIVGNLRVEQAWGAAQISGALHEVIPLRISGNGITSAVNQAVSRDYGFALNGGVKVNLPFVANGDNLWLQASYGQGTTGYFVNGFRGFGSLTSGTVDSYATETSADAYAYIGADGRARISLAETYGGVAAFQHYWTPTIRQAIFGAFSETSYGRFAAPQLAGASYAGGPAALPGAAITRTYEWQVGSQLVWSPVKDLNIGGEVMYAVAGNNNRGGNYVGGALPVNIKREGQALQALVRVERDF